MTADGLATILSSFEPKETMDRLEAEIKARGMTVFARVDHAAGAAEVGLPLRPTVLLIFGNAKAGTPLMQANQAIGIDRRFRQSLEFQAQRRKEQAAQSEVLAREAAEKAGRPVTEGMRQGLAERAALRGW